MDLTLSYTGFDVINVTISISPSDTNSGPGVDPSRGVETQSAPYTVPVAGLQPKEHISPVHGGECSDTGKLIVVVRFGVNQASLPDFRSVYLSVCRYIMKPPL